MSVASDPLPPLTSRPDLLGLDLAELTAVVAALADRPFRARQIFDALHLRGATEFAAMTELPQALRNELALRFRLDLPGIVERQTAPDETTKYLLRLADGATVEAVDIPDGERRTLCVSSQAGCALACAFCVTGYWGAGRNLTAGEIIGQIALLRRERPLPEALDASSSQRPRLAGDPGRSSRWPQQAESPTCAAQHYNVVFMGMGEPLLNLASLHTALGLLATTISWRRITVSTAGVVPGIDEMARWEKRPNLAVSLHAPDDERRSALMPINRNYPLAELLAALRRFPLEPRRRLTVEYLLIANFNDRLADADALARRLRGLRTKVNLIPLNPDPVLGERMRPPTATAVTAFQERLAGHGLTVTVRRRRGGEVAAACGQLRAFGREARGFRLSGLSF